ncbi:MAG: glycosyltransferase family 2 protein [Acutalibacteraceae bacterium]
MGEASIPKATIVVPVYNSAHSIQRCLDSLLAQSERSIQVVCVNDGSVDDSLNVLRQIAQADDHVLVIDQENAGVSCARNAGIDAAVGETVFFVDADDYIDAQTVERVLHAMESADAEARRFWRCL